MMSDEILEVPRCTTQQHFTWASDKSRDIPTQTDMLPAEMYAECMVDVRRCLTIESISCCCCTHLQYPLIYNWGISSTMLW